MKGPLLHEQLVQLLHGAGATTNMQSACTQELCHQGLCTQGLCTQGQCSVQPTHPLSRDSIHSRTPAACRPEWQPTHQPGSITVLSAQHAATSTRAGGHASHGPMLADWNARMPPAALGGHPPHRRCQGLATTGARSHGRSSVSRHLGAICRLSWGR